MTEEIIKLIDMFPRYISYIYPGFVTIWLYYFFRAQRFVFNRNIFYLSVGISFFYIIFSEHIIIPILNLQKFKHINCDVSDVIFNVILFIISIAVPYIIHLLVRWNKIDKVLQKMCKQTSVKENEFDLLQSDYKNTIFITVYLRNSNLVYSGYAKQKEMDKDSRRFICLWKFRKFETTEGNDLRKIDDHIDDNKERVILYYDDISHFEVSNIDK